MNYDLKNERETLQAVRNLLTSGEVRQGEIGFQKPGSEFNMGNSCIRNECGTVACIGGYAWLTENPGDADGASQFVYDQLYRETKLNRLFFPDFEILERADMVMEEVTIEQAVKAIDNYLDENNLDDPWEDVL